MIYTADTKKALLCKLFSVPPSGRRGRVFRLNFT